MSKKKLRTIDSEIYVESGENGPNPEEVDINEYFRNGEGRRYFSCEESFKEQMPDMINDILCQWEELGFSPEEVMAMVVNLFIITSIKARVSKDSLKKLCETVIENYI